MINIRIGLDLFGYGNIGDDIMIAGFAQGLKNLGLHRRKIYGPPSSHPASQLLRCPEISWNSISQEPSDNLIWAAVGDTPFQLTWGDWVLRQLLSRATEISSYKKKVMICVGAESEMLPRATDYNQVARLFDRISTRDDHTYRIITDSLGIPPDRVYSGADLANISLASLFAEWTPQRKYPLGTILMADTLSREDVRTFAAFIDGEQGRTAFVAGDVRCIELHEAYVYEELRREGYFARNVDLVVPPYYSGTLQDLVRPIAECETVISSRYHCLLTAAWAGCRIGAIGRSSKVTALARDLGVPCQQMPLTVKSLNDLRVAAHPVSTKRLHALRERALEGIAFCLSE